MKNEKAGLVLSINQNDGLFTMKNQPFASLIATLLACITSWSSDALANTFAYVSLDGENKIVVYSVNDSDGMLSRQSETKLEGSAGPLCVSPD
ncbi:MAG TPA: hypothetical protein DCO70_10960, partial [Verrucomicrobiales bacterium]|nr:hypothetical protein [Verrucomicrobiales bacterium]